MSLEIKTTERKQPLQARAKATRDAILQSAAHILVSEGFAKLTTNRVAERAGASIGSLYQYFPNKGALVAALRESHRDDVNQIVGAAFRSSANDDLTVAIRKVVAASIDAHLVDPALHRALSITWPDVGRIGELKDPAGQSEDSAKSHVKNFFVKRGLPGPVADRIGAVSYEIVEGLIHAALIEKRLELSPQELLDEITTVLDSYLDSTGVFKS